MFQKDMRVSLLLDFYGDILSERRRELIDYYYNDDLSLGEIAEISGISRQGVRDSIKKSEKELSELEDKLGLTARFETLRAEINDISESLTSLSARHGEIAPQLSDIAEKLKKLSI